MKTYRNVLILSLTLFGFGCGGSQAEPQTPAAPTESAAAPDTTAASAEPAAEGAQAAAPSTPKNTNPGPQITPEGVLFNYKPAGTPGKIYLAGNFNGWNPSNNDYLLKDEDGDGLYSILIPLKTGTYQYKFVVDGQWIKDPNAPKSHPDGFGGQNGKFDVP